MEPLLLDQADEDAILSLIDDLGLEDICMFHGHAQGDDGYTIILIKGDSSETTVITGSELDLAEDPFALIVTRIQEASKTLRQRVAN